MTLTLKPWERLAVQLQPSDVPLDAFCAQCQEQLPLFISDELARRPVDDLYPEIAAHLDVCGICLYEYEALSLLLIDTFY
jgi:hypothetical protein